MTPPSTPSRTGRWRLVASACVLSGALAACGSSSSKASSTSPSASGPAAATGGGTATAPNIKDFAFSPNPVQVKVGTAVTWTNQDSAAHTVQADDSSFGSKNLGKGQTYAFTFSKAGTYQYHCAIHTYMTGKVVVS